LWIWDLQFQTRIFMSKKSTRRTSISSVTLKPVAQTSRRSTPTPRAVAAAAPVAATPAPAVPVKPSVDAEAQVLEAIHQLRDSAAERAVEAAEQLGRLGDSRAVAPLIDVLQNAENYYHVVTRAAAAMALGKLGTTPAIDALRTAINDSSAEVSSESILALAALRATDALPALIEIIRNFNGYYLNVTRHAAVRALGQFRAAGAAPTLSDIASNPAEDPALVAAAREALAQI
jgi:HEAT repeat protein